MASVNTLEDVLDLPRGSLDHHPAKAMVTFPTPEQAELEVARLKSLPGAPKTYPEACETLPAKEVEFINLVMEGLKHNEAAAKAYGLKNRSAVNKGTMLTTRTPRVMLALELARRGLAQAGKYNAETAFNDFTDAMLFAKQENNPAAFTRAVEMRAKLTGVLGKDDARPEGTFQLHIHAG